MFLSQNLSPDVHTKEDYMGEGRWGKFYFCIFLSKSTPFNSVYIFIYFFLCAATTEVSSKDHQWFVYSFVMGL